MIELSNLPLSFIYLSVGLFALAIGSLLNVVIYRLPIMLKQQWQEEYADLFNLPAPNVLLKNINLFTPRSFCTQCKNTIPFWANIPVLSFIFLGGRCHYCKTKISWRYPSIEVLSMGLSLLALYHFGIGFKFIFALFFIWISICLFFIDLDHQILPDTLTLSLLWLGLFANVYGLYCPIETAVISAMLGYLSLWLFIKLFYLLTGKIGMGHGDFKLFAAYGAWFGWIELPFIILSASILGAIIGLIYLKSTQQDRQTPIPFGPFLCFTGLVALYYGPTILGFYLHFSG